MKTLNDIENNTFEKFIILKKTVDLKNNLVDSSWST